MNSCIIYIITHLLKPIIEYIYSHILVRVHVTIRNNPCISKQINLLWRESHLNYEALSKSS